MSINLKYRLLKKNYKKNLLNYIILKFFLKQKSNEVLTESL
jgi:hypothetical protein